MLLIMTLAAVMLGVSAWQAPAQVHSLNVVGYYNVTLVRGWNLLANQLIQGNFNANHVLPLGPPDGSLLYRFDPATQNYYDAGTYIAGLGWYPLSGNTNDSVLNLLPGESFFIWTPETWIATFVGGVAQGTLINPLPANYSLKSSMVPQPGLLTTVLGFPPYPGDLVWRRIAPAPTFSAYAYDDVGMQWTPSEPNLSVGEGFFLYRAPAQATPGHYWIRNFTVQFAPSPPPGPKTAAVTAGASSAARIRSLSFKNGNAVLVIQTVGEGPYNVQFSLDRVSWTTIAVGQTAALWQEPARGGVQGYYQLVNP